MSARFRDLWARSREGLALHARAYGDTSATALPVVCLPGLARNAADFHELATLLTDEGDVPRQVIAVDYRGRGRSDHDWDPSRYTVPIELADLLNLMETVEIGPAVFIGASRGGIITMALAAERPDLVRGAILNDIGPRIELAGLMRIKSYVGKLGQPRDMAEAAGIVERLFGSQFPDLTERDWRAWAAATWQEAGAKMVLSYDEALARTLDPVGPDMDLPDMWPLFEALKPVPVMVIRGERSDVLSAETVARMGEVHPRLEAITVPGQGHTPLLHGPDLVASIRAFVERCDAPSPAAAFFRAG